MLRNQGCHLIRCQELIAVRPDHHQVPVQGCNDVAFVIQEAGGEDGFQQIHCALQPFALVIHLSQEDMVWMMQLLVSGQCNVAVKLRINSTFTRQQQ